jgi:hypothetical protein
MSRRATYNPPPRRPLKHVLWQSAYRASRGCRHLVARELENDEPIEHPDPLPWVWFPIVARHWVCDDCGVAVSPSAFREHELLPLPEEVKRAWWDRWRAYERSVNGVSA